MTAVLFITYRRYDTAAVVFQSIRNARPPRLYFASNSANPNHVGEEDMVERVRGLLKEVDWECDVFTLFRENHLLVKDSIPSAIDWFFDHEEEGIILEDDCLPSHSFYRYCTELLEIYRHEKRVFMIGGSNFQRDQCTGISSYYFSNIMHIWGWATWRSRWREYSRVMDGWETLRCGTWLESFWSRPEYAAYWKKNFDKVYFDGLNTWDYQWLFSCWKNDGVACTPNTNLVSNIGFGKGAEHTHSANDPASAKPLQIMPFPLRHPARWNVNEKADCYTMDHIYQALQRSAGAKQAKGRMGRRIFNRLWNRTP